MFNDPPEISIIRESARCLQVQTLTNLLKMPTQFPYISINNHQPFDCFWGSLCNHVAFGHMTPDPTIGELPGEDDFMWFPVIWGPAKQSQGHNFTTILTFETSTCTCGIITTTQGNHHESSSQILHHTTGCFHGFH